MQRIIISQITTANKYNEKERTEYCIKDRKQSLNEKKEEKEKMLRVKRTLQFDRNNGSNC